MSARSDDIGKEICKAFGLKHVRKMDIHLEAHKRVVVDVEFLPDKDEVKAVEAIIKRYTLEEQKEGEAV